MNNKKSQAVLEFIITYGWAILVILAAIGTLAYFGILSPEKFVPINSYCKSNPDKCVCEKVIYEAFVNVDLESKTADIPDGGIKSTEICLQFRKKTQAELDIDNCNSNPREDDLCTCEELSSPNNYNLIGTFDEIAPIAESWLRYSAYPEERTCNTNQSYNNNEIIQVQCSQKGDCIKSRPKTKCEKGNQKFIQETNIAEVDTSITPHLECKLQQGWFCPAVGIVNLPCDNLTGKCYLHYDFETNSMGLAYIGCEYREDICISNQTICRERT